MENWSTNEWDFGTSRQYPALKYVSGQFPLACTNQDPSTEEGRALIEQPQCGSLLPHQRTGLSNLQILTANARLATDFAPTTTSYILEVPTNTTTVQVQLTRNSDDAVIMVGSSGTQSMTLASNENQSSIPIGVGTIINIMVKDTFASTLTYTLTVKYPDIVLQKGIMIEGTANEGETLTLSLPADAISGGSGTTQSYSYRWEYQLSNRSQLMNPTLEELSDTTTQTLTVRIPTDFIGRDYGQSDVVFMVTVGEAGSMVSTESTVTIIKQDNSDTPLDVDLLFNSNVSGTTLTAVVNISGEDGDGGVFRYSWQSLALDDTQWRDVKTENTTNTISTYTLVEGTTPTTRYRVEVQYTDAQSYTTTMQFGPYRTDVDIDDDGLVEIYYLEDLDAIRHQPDGAGYQPAPSGIELNSMGCDEDGGGTCSGYEIARHLDFRNDAHYQDLENKATWTRTIPDPDESYRLRVVPNQWSQRVRLLEGNGNTISGLYISRNQANQGLFSSV